VNLPNGLTLSRLAAIPVLMVLLLVRFPGHDQLAAALFIVFSFTDTLDGQIARRRGTISDFGKFLDPLADKLFVLSVLIVLVQEGLVAAWVVVVIFSRELMITILRSVGAGQGRVIAAAPLGKTKTVMQMSAVALLILQRPYPVLVPLADLAVAVAIVFTLWSGIDYLWRFRHLIAPAGGWPGAAAAGPSGTRPTTDGSDDLPARELGEVLRRGGMTVSVAESCTGGLVGALITDQPGSSAYFLGGVIAYADEVKRDQLGVPAALLKRVGAVSREVAEAMAAGARSRFGSTLSVGVTGIAGPDADGSGKPVGLTYVAVASPGGVSSHEYTFDGDRWFNRRQAATRAIRLLTEAARVVERSRAKTA
jgi:CDP-diacylglycerol--glycerol-3-phosphate 3-phosphatidyltransferase